MTSAQPPVENQQVVADTTAAPSVNTTLPSPSRQTIISQKFPGYITHRVRRGETLAQIADDYGTTVAELRRINRLRKRSYLIAGETIRIPRGALITEHRVRRGENIGTIAALYGVRQAELVQWNPQLTSGIVKQGDMLTIYVEPQGKGSARATPRTVN
jgi:LysM repeat protein